MVNPLYNFFLLLMHLIMCIILKMFDLIQSFRPTMKVLLPSQVTMYMWQHIMWCYTWISLSAKSMIWWMWCTVWGKMCLGRRHTSERTTLAILTFCPLTTWCPHTHAHRELDKRHKDYVAQNVCWKDCQCLFLTDAYTDHRHTLCMMLFSTYKSHNSWMNKVGRSE
jgi:hypothetical protein